MNWLEFGLLILFWLLLTAGFIETRKRVTATLKSQAPEPEGDVVLRFVFSEMCSTYHTIREDQLEGWKRDWAQAKHDGTPIILEVGSEISCLTDAVYMTCRRKA